MDPRKQKERHHQTVQATDVNQWGTLSTTLCSLEPVGELGRELKNRGSRALTCMQEGLVPPKHIEVAVASLRHLERTLSTQMDSG